MVYENGLKHMLQKLSNLVCLGDDFRRFSHPNAQNLAQSQNSQIMCLTCSALRLGSASISLSPCSCLVVRFHGDQRWGCQEKRARRRFLCCAFVSGGLGIAFLRGSARGGSSKVFPGVESSSGCRAVSSAVSLGQVETSQSWRK